MVLAKNIDRSVFENAPVRRRIGGRFFFQDQAPKHQLIEALNEAGRVKAQLVDAGRLPTEQFARELEQVARRYHLELTQTALLAIAERFDREEKWEKSAKYYRLALEKTPGNADIQTNLGAALGRVGKFKDSIAILRQVLHSKPTSAKALNNLAASLRGLGHFDEAMSYLDQAIKLDPTYDKPYLNKGNIYCQNGDHVRAMEEFRKALDLPNPPPFAYALLGMCLMESNQPAEATRAFKQGIEAGIRDPGAYFNLALALGTLGRKEEALRTMALFEGDPRTMTLLKNPEVAGQLAAFRNELKKTSKLSDLVNAVEIELPDEVDFSDWEQLSSHLASLRG